MTGYNVYVNGALATTSTDSEHDPDRAGARHAVRRVGQRGQRDRHSHPRRTPAGFTLLEKPSAPAITKAKSGKKGGKKTASVAWSAPSSTGGLPITGYQVIVLKAKNGKVVKTVSVAAEQDVVRREAEGREVQVRRGGPELGGCGPPERAVQGGHGPLTSTRGRDLGLS